MSGAAVPPGWYPDPWHPGVVRWFDGTTWTGYTSLVAPGALGDVYDGEQGERTSRFAAVAFVASGAIAAFQAVASAYLVTSFWDDLAEQFDQMGDGAPAPSPFGSFSALGLVSQALSLVALIPLVFLCIWTWRATKNARALGLRTTLSPAVGVLGWIIPLASMVMPYLSVRDLFPEDSPRRRQVGIWWACEITGIGLSIASTITGLVASSGPAVLVAVVSAAALVVAGVLGLRVARASAETHRAIAAGQPVA